MADGHEAIEDEDDNDDYVDYSAAAAVPMSDRYSHIPRTVTVHRGHKIVKVGERYRIFWPEWEPYRLSHRSFGTVSAARDWLDSDTEYAATLHPAVRERLGIDEVGEEELTRAEFDELVQLLQQIEGSGSFSAWQVVYLHDLEDKATGEQLKKAYRKAGVHAYAAALHPRVKGALPCQCIECRRAISGDAIWTCRCGDTYCDGCFHSICEACDECMETMCPECYSNDIGEHQRESVTYASDGKTGAVVAVALGGVGATVLGLLYFMSRKQVTSGTVGGQEQQKAMSEVGPSADQSANVQTGLGNRARSVGSRVVTVLGPGTVVCISGGVVVSKLDSGSAWGYAVEGMSGLAETGARTLDDLDAFMCQWKSQGKLTEAQRQAFISCLQISEPYKC